MANTPNTVSELLSINEASKDDNPYNRAPVNAAMDALLPGNGGNLGDIQAVAELCLHILQSHAEDDAAEDDDQEWRQIMAKTNCHLKNAQFFLEKAPYTIMNDQEID